MCQPVVEMVESLACDSCEVIVYDLSKPCHSNECVDKATQYGVHSLPAVFVNGVLLDCCVSKPVSVTSLKKAGIGLLDEVVL